MIIHTQKRLRSLKKSFHSIEANQIKMIENLKVNIEIDDFLMRFNNISKGKENILVGYSGGKDSDIILSLLDHHELKDKVQFVFFNTGIEFQATIKHVQQRIDEGYNIKVLRAKKPVPLCCRQYGQPFVSKYVSEMLERLQNHNFNFMTHGRLKYNELIKLYDGCISALRWWSNYYGSKYE